MTYLNVPRMLGIGRNAVTLELPAGAGLYTNGVVTLRGVTIGQVDEVRLTPTGVEADIQVLDDHPIPVDSAVEVRSVSAVGEQYVNFEPRTTAGPFIEDGAVVPADRVVLPTTTGELLEKANALAASVPGQKLNATVDDLGKAFAGSGDDLQRLIDSLDLLTTEAQANLDPTVRLIEDAARCWTPRMPPPVTSGPTWRTWRRSPAGSRRPTARSGRPSACSRRPSTRSRAS